jgi:hypothetical protein
LPAISGPHAQEVSIMLIKAKNVTINWAIMEEARNIYIIYVRTTFENDY